MSHLAVAVNTLDLILRSGEIVKGEVVYAEAYVPSLKLKYAQVAIIRVNLMLDY